MLKNWLIRTKSNHILGPVSKEKIIELYQNGSIRPEDEVCSGNGYWFFMREKELVESYILGDNKQSFNPISEARDVLTAERQNTDSMMEVHMDQTQVGKIDLSQFNISKVRAVPKVASVEVEETQKPKKELVSHLFPESSESGNSSGFNSVSEIETELVGHADDVSKNELDIDSLSPPPLTPGKIKKKQIIQGPVKGKVSVKERKVSDKFFMISTVIILLLIAGMLYFRKRIASEFLEGATFQLMPNAYAQEASEVSKKKTFG